MRWHLNIKYLGGISWWKKDNILSVENRLNYKVIYVEIQVKVIGSARGCCIVTAESKLVQKDHFSKEFLKHSERSYHLSNNKYKHPDNLNKVTQGIENFLMSSPSKTWHFFESPDEEYLIEDRHEVRLDLMGQTEHFSLCLWSCHPDSSYRRFRVWENTS